MQEDNQRQFNTFMKRISVGNELLLKSEQENADLRARCEAAEKAVANYEPIVEAARALRQVWINKGHGGVKEGYANLALEKILAHLDGDRAAIRERGKGEIIL